MQAVVDVAGPVTTGGLNPTSYVTADNAPTLIIHGTADRQVSTQERPKACLDQALLAGRFEALTTIAPHARIFKHCRPIRVIVIRIHIQ